MTELTEKRGSGFFIACEANGTISRQNIVVKSGAGVLAVGTILGKITATGKYVQVDLEASDGSQNTAGILYGAVDATDADMDAVAMVRHAEVVKAELIYPTDDVDDIAAVDAALLALQIKVMV